MDVVLQLTAVFLLCLPVSGNIPSPPDMSQGLCKTISDHGLICVNQFEFYMLLYIMVEKDLTFKSEILLNYNYLQVYCNSPRVRQADED